MRIYPYDEARAQALVTELFFDRGVSLQPTGDPHVLLSLPRHDEVRTNSWDPEFNGIHKVYNIAPSGSATYTEDRRYMVIFKPVTLSSTGVRVAMGAEQAWANQAERSNYIATSISPVRVDDRVPPGFTRAAEEETMVAAALDRRAALEGGQGRPDEPSPSDLADAAGPLPDPAQAAQAASGCALEARDLEPLLRPGHLLLLSDPMGAAEPWAAVDQVLCVAALRGLPVTLALSLPATEQGALNRFLESSGDAGAHAELLRQPFWNRPWQDGRSSQAVLEQLERVRGRRAAGERVTVLAVDASIAGNRRMAYVASRLLAARVAAPERALVAVLGNAFVTKQQAQAWDPTLQPVGARLAAVLPEQTHSLDVAFEAGTQWACQLRGPGQLACGTWRLSPGPAQISQAVTPRVYFRTFGERSPYGFDGVYYVGGRLTASPPAVVALRHSEGIVLERRAPPK